MPGAAKPRGRPSRRGLVGCVGTGRRGSGAEAGTTPGRTTGSGRMAAGRRVTRHRPGSSRRDRAATPYFTGLEGVFCRREFATTNLGGELAGGVAEGAREVGVLLD